jgi:hypothetical protein
MEEADYKPQNVGELLKELDAIRRLESEIPRLKERGQAALSRLFAIACRDTGQAAVVARFLRSLYDSDRFKFDLASLRALDIAIFEDCVEVLRLDYLALKSICYYIDNGEMRFDQLASERL